MKTSISMLVATACLYAGGAVAGPSRDLGRADITGATLATQVCSMCHGVKGVSVSPNFPNLAAQQPAYVTAQLKAFRDKSREDPAGFEYMWGISRHLTDEQVDSLASYYAAQSPTAQPAEGTPQHADAGRTLFEQGAPDRAIPACSSCHGDHGQGLAGFPRLAGQHADYVRKQLLVFRNTDQRPEGAVMKVVAHGLDAHDIADVADYVQTLH